MQHIFWLESGKLAGRTGPNNNPWVPDEFVKAGFSAIISVNDGELCHVDEIEQSGLAYVCIPMSGNAPPRPGDKDICLDNLPRALDFIKKHLASGKVLIHCRSGKDRTGLLMAYYMLDEHAMTVDQAMDRVWQVRPTAFTAEGWRDFCRSILDECYVESYPQ